jgi:hypothetical protein
MFIFFLWYPAGTHWLSREKKLNKDYLALQNWNAHKSRTFFCVKWEFTLYKLLSREIRGGLYYEWVGSLCLYLLIDVRSRLLFKSKLKYHYLFFFFFLRRDIHGYKVPSTYTKKFLWVLYNWLQTSNFTWTTVRMRSLPRMIMSNSWQLKLIHSLAVWWLASKLLPTWHESWVSCKKEIYNPCMIMSTSWQLKLIHSLAVWWLASKLLPTWHESWVSCKKEILPIRDHENFLLWS